MSVIYRLSLFFLLTLVFTWGGILGNQLWPSEYWLQPMNPLGPLMAAPLAILITAGRAGLAAWWRRVLTLRAPAWVYAVAVLGPLAIIAASMSLAGLAGMPLRPVPEFSPLDALIMVPIILLAGPMPEELAFRGHAQHELQKLVSPLVAALVIGLGVVIWHLPLLVTGDMAWPWMIAIVAVSVVYAWLYVSGESPWPVVTVHFVVNYFGSEFLGAVVSDPATQIVYAQIYAGFYVAWAVLIVLLNGPSLRRARLMPGTLRGAH